MRNKITTAILNFSVAKFYFLLKIFLLSFVVSQISCSSFQDLSEQRNKAEIALAVICEKLPIPSDFVDIGSDKTLDLGKVVITRRFKSKKSCEFVRENFFSHFIKEGWKRDQMTEEQSRGGMESLDSIFRDNDNVVWVACQNDIDDKNEKQIIVSCSWGLK